MAPLTLSQPTLRFARDSRPPSLIYGGFFLATGLTASVRSDRIVVPFHGVCQVVEFNTSMHLETRVANGYSRSYLFCSSGHVPSSSGGSWVQLAKITQSW